MKILILISICSLLLSDTPKEKNGLLVLTDENFESVINSNEYLVIMFYAPWSGKSKKFTSELEKASQKLKTENITASKINVIKNKAIAQKYNIVNYPTIKLFIKGEAYPYNGEKTGTELINWAKKKKNSQPAKEYKKEEEIKKEIEKNDVFIMYFGQNENNLNDFKKVALIYEDEFSFGSCNDSSIAEKFNTTLDTIILFKNFDEKRNELNDLTKENLISFIEKYTVPKITPITQKNLQKIFNEKKILLVLYMDKNSDKFSEFEKLMTTISEKLKGEILVSITNIIDDEPRKLSEAIGIKYKDLPIVLLLDTGGKLKNYKMTEEINEKNILNFVSDWKNNKLKPYFKSAQPPEKNDDSVFVVVGTTYEKEVINNDKDVMLLFYAPWCGHCRALHPKYEEMAKKLKTDNPKLVIAKIDATENEIENIQISGFPTIKFYPGNKKSEMPIEYNGDRSVDDMIKFIKNNAFNSINYKEEKKEKKDKKSDKHEEL